MKIEYENICYVLLRINKAHPITKYRHDLIWYPENAMSLVDTIQYKPYIKSIVTENAWIIATYDRNYVRIWDIEYKTWRAPNDQTYGRSIDGITSCILKIRQTIPSIALDGGDAIKKLIKENQNSY